MEYRKKRRRLNKTRVENGSLLDEVSEIREILLEFEPLLTRTCEGMKRLPP